MNELPDAGLDTIVELLQLSLAVTVNVTTELHELTVIFEEQVITGASVSFTVTLKVQELVLPFPSDTVLVTIVDPTLNVLPDAGLLTTVVLPQLSLAFTVKATTALQLPKSVDCVISIGQLMDGASVSFTVTLNVHELVLPLPSDTVLVTDRKSVV